MAGELRAWHRLHQSGMVALVFELPFDQRFAAGAAPENATASLDTITATLDGAKAWADGKAKCALNCTCPAWTQ